MRIIGTQEVIWFYPVRPSRAAQSQTFICPLQKLLPLFPSMPLFQMPDSVEDLTQPVTPVDDRGYLSVAMSSLMDGEVLFARSRNKHHELLAHER